MKYQLITILLMGLPGIVSAQEPQPVTAEEIAQEAQYWDNLFNAIEAIGAFKEIRVPYYLQGVGLLTWNAAVVQLLSHALFVRFAELPTQETFLHKLRKAGEDIADDENLKKELDRLMNMNLSPYWYLGKKMSAAQISGTDGQKALRVAIVSSIFLKQAERVRKMVDDQLLELQQKDSNAPSKTLIDMRIKKIDAIKHKLELIINECRSVYENALNDPEIMKNKLLHYYLQHISKSIRYTPDQAYLEEMETIGSLAQALYPSVMYKKYMK